ncbi:MAG: NAD(P)/FAD-dependent oxidoreductase [Candidatus Thermoplasmatota archaeon]|nr:NAD(P)/FAD-dependent oxidoreductase [Candidatus Thermoplasmatota archaeon]
MGLTELKDNSEKESDVMIVGGGPAGLSTWLHLHKYAPELASKSILIEKAKYPRDKLCGGGVGAWSGRVLNNLDVQLTIPSVAVSDIEFIFGKDTFLLHQPNSFQMVQRKDFDHALAKTAVNRGLRLHENEMFLDFSRKNNLLYIKTNKGVYKVKILVGADGSVSKVRQKMRTGNISHLAQTLEVFAPANSRYDSEYDKKKIVVDMTYQTQGLQGYVWHVPHIKGGVPFIGHGLVDFRMFKNKPRANLKQIFYHELNERNVKINPGMWRSHPIRWPSKEDIISNPNIVLVGDAIGIEPAFGGGIHFALSYGDIAANAIIDAFQRNDFSFKEYQQRVQSHLVGKFINKCSNISLKLYDNKMDPFEAAREVFTIKQK